MVKDRNPEIEINDKVEIRIDNQTRVSALIQEKEDGLVSITVPVHRGRPYLLEKGQTYEAIIFHGERLFGFVMEVTAMIHEKIPMYKVRLQDYLGLVQRRGSVRAPVNFFFAFIPDEGAADKAYRQDEYKAYYERYKDKLHEGIILDMSAGGMQFSSTKRLDMGATIRCFIDIEELHLMCVARVVRRFQTDTSSKGPVRYGAAFEGIDMRSEDQVIRFVFTMLRQNRKS